MEIRDIVLDITKVSNLRKKEFLVLTNSLSQTRNITEEMKFLLINNPNVAIVSENTKTTISISSKLSYEIIISHSLDVLRGLKLDGIYVDISTNLEKLKKIKELYPQINLKYYGVEDFIQRKIFEVFDILEVENILKNCDIAVKNTDGSFRLMNEVLKDLAERWNKCHEYIFAEIMNRYINT